MKDEVLELSKMTVEDLFQAKAKRRQRLASLPFEQKIEIVKRLQSVYPLTQVGFGTLLDDVLKPISLDLGIHIDRVSTAMIRDYVRGQWLYNINQHAVTVMRWLTGKEELVEGWEDPGFKPKLVFGAELRAAIDRLRTDSDEPSRIGVSDAERWRQKLPLSFLSFDAANGTWIAEWVVDPIPAEDHVLFDIRFNRKLGVGIEKRLQLHVHMTMLSDYPANNLRLIEPLVMQLLESAHTLNSVWIRGQTDNNA